MAIRKQLNISKARRITFLIKNIKFVLIWTIEMYNSSYYFPYQGLFCLAIYSKSPAHKNFNVEIFGAACYILLYMVCSPARDQTMGIEAVPIVGLQIYLPMKGN